MEVAVSAARWVVSKALAPVTHGVLEAWAASAGLGPNVDALKTQLLYARALLDNAHEREIRSPALKELLHKLRQQAYDADDVLDELEYFRIQDELDGTYQATMPPMCTPAGVASTASPLMLDTQPELLLLNSSPPPLRVARSVVSPLLLAALLPKPLVNTFHAALFHLSMVILTLPCWRIIQTCQRTKGNSSAGHLRYSRGETLH